jgi:hypothetical protein
MARAATVNPGRLAMIEADAKELLDTESELIGKLIDTARSFMQNLSGAQADVLNDWPEFFTRWRETNQKTRNSAKFNEDLEDERAFLEVMLNSIPGNTPAADFWRKTLNSDIDVLDRLLSPPI